MIAFRLFVLSLIFNVLLSNKVQADTIHKQRFALQLAPAALHDVYNGASFKLGTNIRFLRNFYFSADYGIYLRNFNYVRNCRGFNMDIRVKYQFPDSYSRISLQYFHKKLSFEYHDQYTDAPGIPVIVSTQKEVHCFNLNFEQHFPFPYYTERAYFDLFAGLGVRFRNVKSSFQTKKDFDKLVEGGDSQSLYFILTPGQNTWLNLNFGMRIGFYLF